MKLLLRFALCLLVLSSSCTSFMQMFEEAPPVKVEQPQREFDNRCEATKIPFVTAKQSPARMDSVKHFSYSYLQFPSFNNQVIDRVEFTLQLCNVPASRPYGLYYQIYMKIGGNPLYFGIQTRLLQPGNGSRGPGFIFSRWGQLKGDELRVNPDDGFHELGKHEGGFIGVRLPHEIKATSYVFELVRERENWYQLFVTPYGEETVSVGSLRLTGNRGLSDFTLTTEAYAMNNVPPADIPYWHLLAAAPIVNDVTAHAVFVTYPTKEYPFGSVQARPSSSDFDDAIGEEPFLNVTYGGRSARLQNSSGRFELP